jgi:hypothetical protein
MTRETPPPEAWALAAGSFGRELAKALMAYATPILWSAGETSGRLDDEVRSGTTFFLDCGQGPFGVTAGHVFEAHKARADVAGVPCNIGLGQPGSGRLFDLRERVIACSHSPDIATYRISPEEIARTGARVVTATKWPSQPPRVGDVVAFVGFPGSSRRIKAPRQISFETFHGAAFVESVSPERICCPTPREWITPIAGMRFPGPDENAAGLSGGPVFCFERGDVLSWRLMGVVSDGGGGTHDGDGAPFLDMIVGARADLINADGTINELPNPRPRRRYE